MVSPPKRRRRRDSGPGRFDGRREQRQTRLRFVHQTFSSSKRDGPLLVPRHVSRRQIRQEHFSQCALHCGLQEPSGSIGSGQRAPSIVSHHVERQFGDLSSGHDAALRVFGAGFASGLLRHPTVVEPPLKRRRMDALLSKATRRPPRGGRGGGG